MNDSQKVILNLLTEITSICEKKHITWVLADKTCARAYMGKLFYKGALDFHIAIDARDCEKLIQEININNIPDRKIEYIVNNSRFRGFYLKYVDTATTMLHLNDSYDMLYPGFYIEIHLLRHKPESAYIRNLEKIWERSSYNFSYDYSLKTLFFRLRRKLSKTALSTKIWKKWLTGVTGASTSIEVHAPYGEWISFPEDFFQKPKKINLFDIDMYIPSDTESYVTKLYGKDWMEVLGELVLEGDQADLIIEGANNIVSPLLSYDMLLPVLREEGLTKKLYSRRKFGAKINKKNKKLSKDAREAWLLAQRSGDRYMLKNEYQNIKSKILNLYKEKDFIELDRIYQLYDTTVKNYLEQGYGMAYDKELYYIYLELLRSKGEKDTVEKLQGLVTEKMLLPLEG